VPIASNVYLQYEHTWSALVHISHLSEQRKLCVSHHNDIRFGMSPCNSAQNVKILIRFVLNQFIYGLFTYVVSNKGYISCNGRMINNWWTAKDLEGRVLEFAWMIIGSSTDSFLCQSQTEESEPDHSPPPSTKVRNVWNHTCTTPVRQGWPTYNRAM
jgi:hypothetical protein